MPEICTSVSTCAGGGHAVVTIGGTTYHLDPNDVTPLSAAEREQLVRLALSWKGVALVNLLNRVILGDEATNVKSYPFFGPGAAITKTNIGISYVNIPAGANGERQLVDLTGCTQFRAVLSANLIGTGPFQVRLIRDGDAAVLYESPSIAQTGERELDTDWQSIPAGFSDLTLLRAQAKSATAADDPVFRRLVLLVR